MKTLFTQSDIETQKIAFNLAQKYRKGIIALVGELGAGKTTFVQGFAKALGIKDKIISPTFVIIRQHKNLFHIDLYRISNFDGLGLEEILSNKNIIVLIEWAEKVKDLLPKNTIWVTFEMLSENKRKITLS